MRSTPIASHISKRPKLPAESPAHGAIHVHNAVRNFRDAPRGVEARLARGVPRETGSPCRRPCLRAPDRPARASRSRVSSIAFPASIDANFAFCRGAVFHLLPVERQNFRFAAAFSRACRIRCRFFRRASRASSFLRAAAARGTSRAIRRRARSHKYCESRGPAHRARRYPPCGTSPTSASRSPARCTRPLPRSSCPAPASGAARSASKTCRCGWR